MQARATVLADVALRSGADGCYSLGTPIEDLRVLLVDLAILRAGRR